MAAKSVIAVTDKEGRVRLFGPLEPGEASILTSRFQHWDEQKAVIVLPIEDADECDGILCQMEISGQDMDALEKQEGEEHAGELLLRWHQAVEFLALVSCHEDTARLALASAICAVNNIADGQDCMAVVGTEMVNVKFSFERDAGPTGEVSPSIQVYTVPVVEGPRPHGAKRD